MTKRNNLLSRGNGKLGESIHTWSIPAVDTCPGRTKLCTRHCYARSGRFRSHHMRDMLQENLDAALDKNFERRVVKEIRRRGVFVLRVHVAGDFFDPSYVRKWTNIAKKCRRTTFYLYTRSWRLPEYKEVLADMASLDNVHVWFSVDEETGTPEEIPPRVRLAYMQTEEDQEPGEVELVFRVPGLRDKEVKRIGLALVCPTENGSGAGDEKTCTSCRRCFSGE